MEIYKWTDDLATNNMMIDADHKKIIKTAQELNQAMASGKGKDVILRTVDFLNDYVKKHFEEEQKLQLKSGYPDYKAHKQKHEYFVNELDQLAKEIKMNPTSAVNTIKLNKLISGWFFGHIKKQDVEVARFINDNR